MQEFNVQNRQDQKFYLSNHGSPFYGLSNQLFLGWPVLDQRWFSACTLRYFLSVRKLIGNFASKDVSSRPLNNFKTFFMQMFIIEWV